MAATIIITAAALVTGVGAVATMLAVSHRALDEKLRLRFEQVDIRFDQAATQAATHAAAQAAAHAGTQAARSGARSRRHRR